VWKAALKILRDNWTSLLLIVVLVGVGVLFGSFITSSKLDKQALKFAEQKQTLTDDFNAQKNQWEQERTAAADKYATDLQTALDTQAVWKQKADALSVKLAENERAYTRKVNDLKQRLKDALKSDGNAYTGIGPAGLQLYTEALGYGNQSVTAGVGVSGTASVNAGAAGNAISPGGGLSAGGIISHATEYGQWCLILRDRLQALKNYYTSQE